MPAVTFPLSSKTVGFLIDAIVGGHSDASMGTLFLKAEVDRWEPERYNNKEQRAQRLLRAMREDGSTAAAVDGALELARLCLVRGRAEGFYDDPSPWWLPLKTAVAADGWEFDETTDSFVTAVPGAQMSAEVTWIGSELRRRGWTVSVGHYEQAIDNFALGNWAAANGQLRSFFESLIRTAGGTTGSTGSGQVQAAFDALDSAQQLISDEADFGKKLWKMLHPAGSHPGLSDEDESRFRLLALTGYARFLLSRLP